MLKGHPCKVISVFTSKTGKHGHAKANITGLDIFTHKKYSGASPTSHNMQAPVVTTSAWSVLGVEDGYLSLINDDGAMKDDMKFPSGELGDKLQSALDTVAEDQEVLIRVMCACGQEALTSFETKEL